MPTYRAPFLYTETRLNLDQGYTGSTVEITLPHYSSGIYHQVKRTVLGDVPAGTDEATFSREHLATDGSVYFRRDERYPRSLLWRLLDERKVLEIQAVDLSQEASERTDALLTILLKFPAAIRPFCLAFGDPDERDALHVFAITTTNELWTLQLSKDFFVHLKATESLAPEWCKTTIPGIFDIAAPFRLFAMSSQLLFASMSDGSMTSITRQAGEDGSRWQAMNYTVENWASNTFKSLTFWNKRNTITSGDFTLDHSTAMSMALSSSGEDGESKHLITVCMNHMIRIWNLDTGRITLEKAILGDQELDQRSLARYLMGPTQHQLLQVMEMPEKQEFYLVTYSPKNHQFKFWAVMDADAGTEGIREMRSDIDFTPPIDELMDTSVWNLEEFYIRPSRENTQTQLWIRVRSGPSSQVFTVTFDPFDFGHKNHEIDVSKLTRRWKEGWTAVHPGRQTVESLDLLVPNDEPEEGSALQMTVVEDQWLDFLLYPGRFTIPTLETALQVFNKAIKRTVSGAALKAPLKARLCSAIAAGDRFTKKQTHHPIEEPRSESQWQVFYVLVRDLHKRRGDATSFVIDPCDQLPWLVSADSAGPIRACSDLELWEFNRSIADRVPDLDKILSNHEKDDEKQIGVLLGLARKFRSSLSRDFQETFKRSVLVELLAEPDKAVPDRMHDLQKDCALREQYSEDDFEGFEEAVEAVGGYSVFASENFQAMLNSLVQETTGKVMKENITKFGAKSLIRTAQEKISMNTEALLDLLSILLFIEDEFEPADLEAAVTGDNVPDAMSESDDIVKTFNATDIFVALTKALREHQVLTFLTSNLRQEGSKKRRHSDYDTDSPSAMRMSGSGPIAEPIYTCTLLESMFIGDWSEIICPSDISMPYLISYWCKAWLTRLDISQYDNFTAHVLADLIKHHDYALATEFLSYVPLTQWSGYLRGRLALATGDYPEAASWFKKAAYPMSLGFFDANTADTSELLRPDERDSFSDGLTSYYIHIGELFGQVKAASSVADFMTLALQAHAQEAHERNENVSVHTAIRRTHSNITPQGTLESFTAEQLDKREKRKTDLLSRLFTASLQTAHYDEAYSALTRLPNTGVRHFSLQTFITTLVSQNRVPLLLSYPFATLESEADDVLAAMAKKTLNLNISPQYHKVLYSFRVARGDWRGAAQVAFERLERLKSGSDATKDPQDERLTQAYLLLINTLVCVGRDEAWVVKEPIGGESGRRMQVNGSAGGGVAKRSIVTINDVRREYQEELDRLAAMDQGKFAFAGGDAMDVL